ncbi:MAG: YwbE family protein [Clostridia bacterium]|nr:YwbE family protein [Clostridia bacterium]
MKIKGIARKDWYRIDKSYTKLAKTKFEDTEFYVAGTYFEKVNQKKIIKVGNKDVCILDDRYIWITIIPLGKHYAITINIDEVGNIIQWYFDVTLQNYLDERGLPCFRDLYIDVTYDISGEINFLDEDELSDALESGDITQDIYNFAIKEANYIKEMLPSYREQLIKVARRWLELFNRYFEKDIKNEKEKIDLVDNHGNIINKKNQVRSYIVPGMRVKIVLKKDQKTGILTEGIVARILTNSQMHHRGIKVMLEDGSVGRVQEIIE